MLLYVRNVTSPRKSAVATATVVFARDSIESGSVRTGCITVPIACKRVT